MDALQRQQNKIIKIVNRKGIEPLNSRQMFKLESLYEYERLKSEFTKLSKSVTRHKSIPIPKLL